MKKSIVFLAVLLTLLCTMGSVFAASQRMNETFNFTGFVYNVSTGEKMNLVNVSITTYNNSDIVGMNYTLTGKDGSFNITGIYNNSSAPWNQRGYNYQILLDNSTSGAGVSAVIGPSLPQLPYQQISQLANNMSFYVSRAYTYNITVNNSTGLAGDAQSHANGAGHNASLQSFFYQVIDDKLDYPIYSSFSSPAEGVSITVPSGRNYTVLVYPNQSVPLSQVVTPQGTGGVNPSAALKFYTGGNMMYNWSVWISGNVSSNTNGTGFDNLTVIPYIYEGGKFVSDHSKMLYNMSAMLGSKLFNDRYNYTNTSSGHRAQPYFNITMPGLPHSMQYVLLFIARNGTTYYGAYRNLTLTGATTDAANVTATSSFSNFNVTVYPLLGDTIINDTLPLPGSGVYPVQMKVVTFNITNGTNSPTNAQVEMTFNFTNYTYAAGQNVTATTAALEQFANTAFKWVKSVGGSTGANANFTMPMFAAPITKVAVYTQDYAPAKFYDLTETNVTAGSINLTLSSFHPMMPNGSAFTNLKIELYRSNESCDIPYPTSDNDPNCLLTASSNFTAGQFNPMQVVFGGGNVSIRFTDLQSGVVVHYVNADLLACGPPDVKFNISPTEIDRVTADKTPSILSEVWRFGSAGPEIYDRVIIGVPYNTSRIDVSKNVSIRFRNLYNEYWTSQWNTTNRSDADVPARFADWNSSDNKSNYVGYINNTGVNVSTLNNKAHRNLMNVTAYMNKTTHMIWFKIPHFSGGDPEIDGEDNESPEISSVNPGRGNLGVGLTNNIRVTFSEAMNPTSVNNTTFYLNTTSGTAVVASIISTTDNLTFTLDPNGALTCGTGYNVTLRNAVDPAGVADYANNTLAAQYTWTFTTASCGGEVTASAGGGGGAAGGAAAPTPIEFVAAVDATGAAVEAASVSMSVGTTLAVPMETATAGGEAASEQHTIKLKEIGSGYAVVTIASTPTEYTLRVNSPKYVDLNGDAISDLKLLLTGTSKTSVDITVTKLEVGFAAAKKGIETAAVEPEAIAPATEPAVEEPAAETAVTETPTKMQVPVWAYWLIGAIIVIAGAAFWLTKKKPVA